MKNRVFILSFLISMISVNFVFAQTSTKKLSYQAVVRNAANELVVNQNLAVEITVLDAENAPQYKETHPSVPTNQNGLLWLWVGEGNPTLGTMADVVWKDAVIRSVFTLPDGSTVTQNTPVTAMPYAYFADEVDTIFLQNYLDTHDVVPDNYVTHPQLNDTLTHYYTNNEVNAILNAYTTNTHLNDTLSHYLMQEVQILSISHDTIFLTGGSFVKLPAGFSGNYHDLVDTPTNVSVFNNDAGYLTEHQSLEGYVTNDKLNDTLGAYYDTAHINQTLKQYLKSSELCDSIVKCEIVKNMRDSLHNAFDTLKYYTTSNEIDTLLGAYYDTTQVKSVISDTATALRAIMGDAAYNSKITLKKNNVELDSFRLNQQTDKAINIPVPTTVAELSDASNYVTKTKLNDTLGAYYDTANVKQMLKPYLKANELCDSIVKCEVVKNMRDSLGNAFDTLKYYTTSNEIDTLLGAYYDSTKVKSVISDTATALRAMMGDAANDGIITIDVSGGTIENPTFSVNQANNQTVKITIPETIPAEDGQLTIIAAGDTTRFTANQATNDTMRLNKFATKDTLAAYYDTADVKQMLKPYLKANELCDSIVKCDVIKDMRDSLGNAFDTLSYYYTSKKINDTLKAYYDTTRVKALVHDSIGNGKITIQKNGATITDGSFYLNQKTDQTINITVPTTVVELTDEANYAKVAANNQFTGTNTVPNGYVLKGDNATNGTNCGNIVVNACDLWAVFDSLTNKMNDILKTIDTLKKVNDSLAKEIASLKPALTVTGPNDEQHLCGGSNTITFTASVTNANAGDYTYSWTVNGTAQSSTGTTMTYSSNTTGSFKVVCTATRPGHDITLKDSTTVNVSAGGDLPGVFGLCKEGLTVTLMISDDNTSSVSWGDGSTTSDVTTNSYSHDYSTSNGAGTYTITAVTPHGCTTSRTITLSETTTRPCTVYSPHTSTTEYTTTTGGLETLVDGKVVSVQDQDGHSYYVTQIGDQCWMRTNLRTTKYNDGTTIPGGVSYSGYSKTDPYHYISPSYNDSIYGYFYNWPAAAHRNSSNRLDLCPKGWHVPSQADLETLLSEAGVTTPKTTGTGAVYLAGGCDWELYTSGISSVTSNSYENPDRDKWDFTAIPAGSSLGSSFIGNGAGVYFWSSTEVDANDAKTLYIGAGYPGVENNGLDKENGRLVRCVRDEGSTPLPTLSISHNPENLTKCGDTPLVVTYTATPSEGEIGDYSYSWSDGTNVISTEATCEITYTSAGNFSVICTATHTDDGYDITADNNITVNSADAPRFAFAVDTTSVIIKVITEGASITDWGGNGTTGGSASFPSVTVFNYSTSGIYNITATDSTSGCVTTRRVAVGEATLHPCAVSSAHPAQTEITGGGLETPASSQDSITTVADYDGNVYAVVQIGSQCWMKSNLRTRHFDDGTQIVNGTETGTVTDNCLLNATSTTVPYYYRPESNSCGRDYSAGVMSNSYGKVSGAYNEKLYGLYYNWSAVMDGKGICPHGWHVPTEAEWNTMIGVVVSENVAENDKYAYLLSEGNDWDSQEYDWNTSSSDPQYKPGWFVESRNASEFSAVLTGLAGGSDSESGTTNTLGRFLNRAHSYAESYFWSSTSNGNDRAVSIKLSHLGTQLTFSNKSINSGYSVRCVRDGESGGGSTTQTDPSVTTGVAVPVGATTAMLSATLTNPDDVEITSKGFEWKLSDADSYTKSTNVVTETTDGFTANITGLTATTSYTFRAFVTYGGESHYGDPVQFTTTAFVCGTSTISDVEENDYSTVQIGNQCWMKSNLRTTKYADGTSIAQATSISVVDATIPYFYDYDVTWYNSSSYVPVPLEERGYLYNWAALMNGAASSNTNPSNVQGICPTGWHVPSRAEWVQLKNYLSSNSDYWCDNNPEYVAKALAATTSRWGGGTNCRVGSSTPANNSTEFTAFPTWYDSDLGGYCALFWTSMLNSDGDAFYYLLAQNETTLIRSDTNVSRAFAVRCVKDGGNTAQIPPTVTTVGHSDVGQETATLNASVTNNDDVIIAAKGFMYWVENGEVNDMEVSETSDASTYTYTFDLTGLDPGTPYFYKAYITYNGDTVYGEEKTFVTYSSVSGFVCGESTVGDADGIDYATVIIGSQCWMAENLRTIGSLTKLESAITAASSPTTFYFEPSQDIIDDYDFDEYDVKTYGLYYGRDAALTICPSGWHLPSISEWENLIDEINDCTSGDLDAACGAGKLAGGTDWEEYGNYGESDSSPQNSGYPYRNMFEFNALPSGGLESTGFDMEMYVPHEDAVFWSSSPDGSYTYFFHINYFQEGFDIDSDYSYAFPVRCVKDTE